MATSREDLKRLIDALPATTPTDVLGRVLEVVVNGQPADPQIMLDLVLLFAPVDDEPVSEETLEAIRAAEADEAAGRVRSHAAVVRRVLAQRRRDDMITEVKRKAAAKLAKRRPAVKTAKRKSE